MSSRIRPSLMAVALAALTCVPAASAAAPKHLTGGIVKSGGRPDWTAVTGPQSGPTELVGYLRTSDGTLHVAWPHGGSLLHATVAPGGAVTQKAPITTGWVSLSSPGLVPVPGGGLRAFFGGIHSNINSDPLRDMATAVSTDAGNTWGAVVGPVTRGPSGSDYAYTSPISAVDVGADHHPVEAWAGGAGLFTHAGIDPGTPDNLIVSGSAAAIQPRIVTTSDGSVAVAYVSQRPAGVYLQHLYADGTAAGAPQLLPFSDEKGQISTQYSRIPVTGRTSNGDFFAAYRWHWPAGDADLLASPTWPVAYVIASSNDKSAVVTGIGSDPRGHVWSAAAVHHGTRLVLETTRSNAVPNYKRWGWEPTVATPLPAGTTQVIDVEASGQAHRADVLVTAMVKGVYETYDTQVLPALYVRCSVAPNAAAHVHTVTCTVDDAGDPVPGAHVKIGGRTLTTSSKGTARVRTTTQTDLAVVASKAGYVPAATKVFIP